MRTIALMLAVVSLSACESLNFWDTGRAVVTTAQDVSLVEKCAQFQDVKNRLHRRIPEIATPDLVRLGEVDEFGRVICTMDIDDLTSELLMIEGKLP